MNQRTLISVLAATLLASPLPAQAVRFVNAPADCNLTHKRWENYLADNGGHVFAPRYVLHGIRTSISLGAGEAAHRLTGWPRWLTYSATGTLLAFAPHVRQVVMGAREINTRDWIFDATLSLAPSIILAGWRGRSWQSKTFAVTTVGASYGATFCFGSP